MCELFYSCQWMNYYMLCINWTCATIDANRSMSTTNCRWSSKQAEIQMDRDKTDAGKCSSRLSTGRGWFFFSFICCLCEKWSIYRDAMIGNRNNLCERLWVVTIWMQPLLYLSQRMSKSIVYFCYFLVVMFRCVLLYFDRAYFQGLHFFNIFAMPSYQSRLNSFFTLFCVSNNVENQSNSTQDKWVDRYQ